MQPRRHQEVARALGARGGEDRRLELEEAGVPHAPADRADDLVPQHDVGVQRLAPQIQEPVLQPQVLRIVGLAEHRDRQLLGRRQHLDLAGHHLDLAGGELRVHRRLAVDDRPVAHLAVDADHPLRAHRLGRLERRAVRVGHHLGDAVVVPQVDEQQPAVVAHAMHPAGEADSLAHVTLFVRLRRYGNDSGARRPPRPRYPPRRLPQPLLPQPVLPQP